MRKKSRKGRFEVGSGTRRRPIGRDYAVAKDVEVGKVVHSAKGMVHGVLMTDDR